jgi:hypothetical protein
MQRIVPIAAALAALASTGALAGPIGSVYAASKKLPTVAFTAPAEGGTLSGNVQGPPNCVVTGSNIARVEFFLNGVWTNTDGNVDNGLGCWIDTTRYPNGSYTVRAVAYSQQGETASATRGIVIDNAAAPPPTEPPPAGAIEPADVMGSAQAEIPFLQQSGYNTQILNQYLNAPSIPETGMHAFTLSNGETLRFGKHVDPLNSTRKVLAFQVDPNDVTTSGAKRAELKFGNNLEMDRVYWAALSVYVYDWGTLASADQGLFGLQQHNGSPQDLSPNFAIYTSGSGRTFQVHARGSSSTSPSYANSVTVRSAALPIPFGRWSDFVFRFKLNTSGAGFLQVWQDGTQIFTHQGILGYITPGYKDFFKFGYYNWSGSSFASTRKVLLRSPVIVADPTGTKYGPEDLRAYVNAR